VESREKTYGVAMKPSVAPLLSLYWPTMTPLLSSTWLWRWRRAIGPSKFKLRHYRSIGVLKRAAVKFDIDCDPIQPYSGTVSYIRHVENRR
jgi:hypothetical protein